MSSFKYIIILLLFLCSTKTVIAQCPNSEIVLTTQQEIDDFKLNYPNCTEINNNLVIKGSSVENLNGLNGITHIEGGLTIGENIIGETTSLIDLKGLDSLRTIKGNVVITRNIKILTLQGLNNLKEIGGLLQIDYNSELLNIDGLDSLNSVHGLDISSNYKLQNIEALSGLTTLMSNPYNVALTISRNDSLKSLHGLESIQTIDGGVVISNNGLLNLDGLRNLKTVNGYLRIELSKYLLNLKGLENLERIEGLFRIAFNTAMVNLEGLDNLKRVAGELDIHSNTLENLYGCNIESIEKLSITWSAQLIDLTGLEGIKNINGDVLIKVNNSLKNLNGLNNLKSIGGEFTISSNNSLMDLVGLEALEEVGLVTDSSFEIEYNDSLQTLNGLTSLSTVGKGFYLSNNIELTEISSLQNLEHIGKGLTISFNDKLTNVNGLEKITELYSIGFIKNDALINLDGLKNLTSANSFSVTHNKNLATLNALSKFNKVDRLIIDNNDLLLNLEGLEALDSINKILIIRNNKNLKSLSGIDNIKSINGYFSLENNTELKELNALSNVNKIEGKLLIKNNDSILNLEGFEALNSINGELVIIENGNLKSLSGIQNIHNESITKLTIKDNQNLNLCETINICNYLTNNGEYIIENNLEGCNNSNEIKALCGDEFNTITGKILYDINDNSCEVDDIPAQNSLVYARNELKSYSSITDDTGSYILYVDEGSFTTTASVNEDYFEIAPQEYTSYFENLKQRDTVDFCLTKKQIARDIAVTLIPLQEARSGGYMSYELIYENKGTSIEDGSLQLDFDNLQLDYLNASIDVETKSTGLLTWNFENLLPFEHKSIIVNFHIFAYPTVNTGDILLLTTSTKILFEDFEPFDNSFELLQTVVGSYDPNEKIVLEGDKISIEEIGNNLHYIIHFQNIGTASAFNVKIEDELDAKLDWKTFQVLTSSHDNLVTLLNDNKVNFLFEDINLTYKDQNEKESQGYVAFRIKPKKGIGIGDIILGQANIFFDFNPPITTNTVSTEVVSNTLSIPKFNSSFINVYPVPSNKFLYLKNIENLSIENLSLFSANGTKLIDKKQDFDYINISNLSSGIYFLKLKTESGELTKKIIKQ